MPTLRAMSFIQELKRRNVFRVGIAYGVTAWLLIQITDILFESIGAPPWIMPTMFVVLGVGFVIAVFFAWAFELTPDGVKREQDVDRSQSITQNTGRSMDFTIIGILVLALGYFVADKFWLTPAANTDLPAIAETIIETQDEPQTIAVLPFVDMSPNGDNEYFSDGLTEELLNFLSKIHELQVAGRTSSFAFKGKDEDLRSIGQKLGVKTILEGSVRKDNSRNRVRITAQLINVENGFHIWSETYDRDLEDIFAIQEEIARHVAQALRVALLGEDEVRITQSAKTELGAYDSYLQGLKLMNTFNYASLNAAVEMFQNTIEQDPDYIPAQLKLVETWLNMTSTGALSTAQLLEDSTPILDSVLSQDGSNDLAYALHAAVIRYKGSNADSKRELRKALDLNPRNVRALNLMGRMLVNEGKATKGHEYLLEAERIDPYSQPVLWQLIYVNALTMQLDKVEAYAARIGEIEPGNPNSLWGPAMANIFAGDYVEALPLLLKTNKLDPDDYEQAASIASIWLELGDLERAEHWIKIADTLGADQPVPMKVHVLIYQYREQYGLAADLAKRAMDKKMDSRMGSEGTFTAAYISELVKAGKIDEALANYREWQPQFFESPPVIDHDSPDNAGDLLDIALLMQKQDPDSTQATEFIDIAEQKHQTTESIILPWERALDRAEIAVARNDKETAIKELYSAWEQGYRWEWRSTLQIWFGFQSLHDEPEYQQLIAMYEQDMVSQREQVYELLGMTK
jgi:TolB-like protein/Tfp pilus assembly protein PilF